MRSSVQAADVERFRGIVAARFGLQFDDGRLEFLAAILRRRLDVGRGDSDQYLTDLEHGPRGDPEAGALAHELTIGETYFFRNIEQFDALAEIALPQRMRERGADKCLRILSAGCASGEEAYTIAMVVKDRVPQGWDVSLRAVDLNPAALKRAAAGRFSSWALRQTSADMQARWFRPEGSAMVLAREIRAAVTFDERNLAADDPDLWRPRHYDIVFCRNVLMYFSPEKMRAVIARIAQSLRPGGYLFLGHAETLRGLPPDFELQQSHETFYYQRLAAGAEHPTTAASSFTPHAGPSAPRERKGRVTAPPAVASPASAEPQPGDDAALQPIFRAIELLRVDRFQEALASVRDLPPDAASRPYALLITAALLAHCGQLEEAAVAAADLLARDPLSAGAHYVLALSREAAGDDLGAAEHNRLAVFLDPDFSMPHLHLGLIAKRAGDSAAMRTELGHALLHLEREDAASLLLFGGGFTRNGLMTLCRAEIAHAGGQS